MSGDHETAAEPCASLAAAIPRLLSLTSLELRINPPDQFQAVFPVPGTMSIVGVVEAATRLPHLQSLHVPVSPVSCDATLRLVQALLKASDAVEVSVDVFFSVLEETRAATAFTVFEAVLPYAVSMTCWAPAFLQRLAALPSPPQPPATPGIAFARENQPQRCDT